MKMPEPSGEITLKTVPAFYVILYPSVMCSERIDAFFENAESAAADIVPQDEERS